MNEPTQAQPAENKDVLITPEGEVLDQSVVGTMKIDPSGHSPVTNKSRLQSLKFAVAGMLYLFKHERSIRLAMIATVLILIAGIWLNIRLTSWALLTIALGGIWITEALNTAIEATINLGTSTPHPMAKVGKDVAAAASLISTLVFLIVTALILLPYISNRFGE